MTRVPERLEEPAATYRAAAGSHCAQSQSFTSSTYQHFWPAACATQGSGARCYPRDAIPVHLPMAGRGAVGRQQLRFRLSCRVAIDNVVLGPDDGREYIHSHHAGDDQNKKSFHSLLRSLWPRRAVDHATDMGARQPPRYEAIQSPVLN